ncbi:bifunctional Thioredoxin [Babesia duncani]|uniref:protein disulfide-isomerase n=1 Tax=Babesia duncani TaxID=323732 RepID=A0AAD9PL14_9APIC|nr:bifunctional Thioredoxin [Babesia duncani]
MWRLLTISFLLLNHSSDVLGALYGPTSNVKVLNGDAFKKAISSEGVAIVEFYAEWCGHCKAFAKHVDEAAKILKNVIPVIAVDDATLSSQYNVKGYPTVKIFQGENKTPDVVEYNGARTSQDLVKFAMKTLNRYIKQKAEPNDAKPKKGKESRNGRVVELTDSNFSKLVLSDEASQWLVMFYAPWCGHCRQLEPEWTRMSSISKDAKIGRVDCTVNTNLTAQFGIKGYPTIKLLNQGPKSASNAITYQGPRNANDILEFAKTHFHNIGPPLFVESTQDLEKYCSGPLCILAFLPQNDHLNQNLEIMTSAIKDNSRLPFKFCYTLANEHPQWESTLGLESFPAVVGLNVAKGIFSLLQTGFSERNLSTFVKTILSGKASAGILPGKLNDSANPRCEDL